MSNPKNAGGGWRLVAELVQPVRCQDTQWVTVGLKTALENAQVGALDLERVNNAAVAAVARAKGRQAKSTAPYEPLTIRVLASAATEACTATRGLGFFVVERTIGESNATVATRQPEADKRRRYCIELHLYTDAGSQ